MTYKDVVDSNCNLQTGSPKWWRNFAFHFTDVQNAVGILDSGFLYSRIDAQKMGLMKTENASVQVIEMTRPEVFSFVRFYFRPKTPTQYHNEGYKHVGIRYDGDPNANVPVPVFFLFDLVKLLNLPGTKFSGTALSGKGIADYKDTPDEFSKLRFGTIYSDGPMSDARSETKYRHAEIVYPDKFEIQSCLRFIACRNDVERDTLLNLLREKNPDAYERYVPKIFVGDRSGEMFFSNGLFISNCRFYDGDLYVGFADTYAKKAYANGKHLSGLKPVEFSGEFSWYAKDTRILQQRSAFLPLDYMNPKNVIFKLGDHFKDDGADHLMTRFFFDGKLVGCLNLSLQASEIL